MLTNAYMKLSNFTWRVCILIGGIASKGIKCITSKTLKQDLEMKPKIHKLQLNEHSCHYF